jgi:hypothetical protein
MNSSEEITKARTIKSTTPGGLEVLDFIAKKVKAAGPRGQTEIHPTNMENCHACNESGAIQRL